MERLDENETLLCLFGGDEKNVVPMCGFSPGAWAGQELMLQNLWRYGLTGADMGAMLGRSVSTGARCAGDPQRMYEQPLAKMVQKQETFIVQVLSVVRGDHLQKYWTTRATHL
ncbi:MAG: hypothetical protein CME31_29045 [Gimesia sp.]|jgi:hypothetical protein|nr:hypothetical protein [Gimesia sp.]|tara:strand:+ start:30181 stop:30519 length:339 start_codon:yes stop_codon:yes gene_type:complete